MPPVILLALVGAAGIAGYRLLSSFSHELHGARRRTESMRSATAKTRNLGSLEWDEAAGVYRPKRDG